MEPTFDQRPPTVSRDWWYNPRTTWHARQRAVRAWHIATRPVDVERSRHDPLEMPTGRNIVSSAERTRIVEQCLEMGFTAEEIVRDMQTKPATIVRALERAGRRELMPDFARLERLSRKERAA